MTTAASNQGSLRANSLAAVVGYAVSSQARAVAVLVLVSLLTFLPGFFQIPPTDRDEARFAQATKQMLETGEYVDIRFQDEVRYKKPVGIYWLQAGVVKAATALGMPNAQHTIWVYRIPSLIGAIGAVLLTYWTALSFVSRRAALLAGLMMATSILLGVEARLAKTDAMPLPTSLAAMAVPSIWVARREKGAKFLLCWIVPAWIVLELVVTKLPHYVLPLYPAIAILIAGVVDPHVLSRNRWLTRGACWWFVLPTILGIGTIVVLVIFGRQLGLPAWPFVAAAMIFGLWAWWLYQADGAEHSLLRSMVASWLLAVAIYAVIIPSLGTAFPSAALARIVSEANCKPAMVATAGYQEPSLVFLLGTETAMVDGTDAAEFLRLGGCRFALVEARHERAFLRRADAIGL